MSVEAIIVIAIIVVAFILFVAEVIPVDQTAILVMVLLMVTGILNAEEAVSGFSNSATLTILALLIISVGLEETGFVDLIGDWMVKRIGGNHLTAIALIMITTAVLSAFINNTAVVGVFLPVMVRIAKNTEISLSKLLIPLSFAAMVGGSSTIMGTSTNLLVNSIAASYDVTGFTLFEFTKVGFILFAFFMGYMLLIGYKITPDRKKKDPSLTDEYALKEFLTEIVIKPDSELIGKKIHETEFFENRDFEILEINRKGSSISMPEEIEKLKENDELVIKASLSEIVRLGKTEGVSILYDVDVKDEMLTSEDSILFEVVIGPNSGLIDKKIKDVKFREEYNAIPLAVRRKGQIKQRNISDMKLNFGDIILVEALRKTLQNFYSRPDFIVMHRIPKTNIEKEFVKKDKVWLSVIITLVVIGLTVTSIFSILVSAWFGVALMFLTGCVTLKKAYLNVHWNVIFLLAGLIPLGVAMEKTGTVQIISNLLTENIAGYGIYVVVAVLFLISLLLTSIVSNNVTVVLLAPIAIELAIGLGMDVKPLLLAVLFGANTSFLTPVGYQTNTMIFGPGNYKFRDFLKVGGILCLIFLILVTFIVPYWF